MLLGDFNYLKLTLLSCHGGVSNKFLYFVDHYFGFSFFSSELNCNSELGDNGEVFSDRYFPK